LNVGNIFQGFVRMEGEKEKPPIKVKQEEDNINPVPSDGQETCGRPSPSTAVLSLKPESPEKQRDSSERTLNGTYFYYS
jgi:hypothetical protein